MSKVIPSRDEGALLVAAVRVQAHRDGRPPLLEDVAALLNMPHELMRVLVIALQAHGILSLLSNAFETRLDIVDAAAVSELPKAGTGPKLGDELDDFRKAFQSKQDDLKQTFGADTIMKRSDERMDKLADKLKKFKDTSSTGPQWSSLSKAPPDDEE